LSVGGHDDLRREWTNTKREGDISSMSLGRAGTTSRRNSKRNARPVQSKEKESKGGGCTHLNIRPLIESIHLIQQLQQNPLNLSVGSGLSIESLGSDGVDLVDEDDGGSVLSSESEDVSDHSRTLQESQNVKKTSAREFG